MIQYFAQRRFLVSPHKTHNCEKPYQCDLRGKHFAFKSNFINHQEIHSEQNSFDYNHANEIYFFQKVTFVNHQRMHSEVKPLKYVYVHNKLYY